MERDAINKKKTTRAGLRSITERLLKDAEIISNEELNSKEKIERLKPLNQVAQEKLDKMAR